ncbi:wax ester/triacylglycerol synthase family O-acyltransferase [Candidatus Binatia bacterium]|nr:wax ester/triacylglycerol synthase family O-acyltransferase [Candidatus Binatia bacterium]
MPYAHYERLSALDTAFLDVEDDNAHMHVGAVSLLDAGPLLKADGTVDIEEIRGFIEASIHRIPRYRQRLDTVPVFGNRIWVDDQRFNLNYHVRHVGLPYPGDERLLKRLAGRIMSQKLDRGKPLWELWVVEGVEGGKLAMINKAHHCLTDGIGSVELLGTLMRPAPEQRREAEERHRWLPRPVPSAGDLVRGELARRVTEPLAALGAAGAGVRDPLGSIEKLRNAVLGLGEALAPGLRPASPTPLNTDIGPHRRFDWLTMDLNAVKAVKNRLGGTVNDVVLAIVGGALRRFLRARGLRVDDLDFRAMIPVNFRSEGERDRLGNRITMMVASLPVNERDPRARLARVIETTRDLKKSRQPTGIKTLEELSDLTLTTLFTAFSRFSTRTRPYNVVVTNVPGPQIPIYFLGAPMHSIFPLVPLSNDQALGIALFSYNSSLFWGFNSDWDAMPDLHEVVAAIETEFGRLEEAAGAGPLEVRADGNGEEADASPRRKPAKRGRALPPRVESARRGNGAVRRAR